ncbi:MAG: hypothetical protein HN778_12675 [Prolixibacteraceae bacterium]|jgi:fructokinase|nr:hypothetical protein [Prolixibacteraceae bacterium]MBT6998139.1 hypothetical protein [Prolixibacteraceae bacterium]MBT7395681.1 hypothetical protein [Prolixibacteraceae bacterium]
MGNKIVAFGEVVWDILPNGKVLGGTPSNMVFRCNSFGDEGFLLSRIGDDELGQAALQRLKELGISDENVQIDCEFSTGTVEVTFDENDEPLFNVKVDVAFDHIEFSAEALKLVRNADCLFFGLLAQRYGISKNTIRELIKESPNSINFFDLKLVEHFFNTEIVERLLLNSNIVRLKEKEIPFISKELDLNGNNLENFGLQFCQKFNLNLVLVTRGQNGVFAFEKNKGPFWDSGYQVRKKDNIGSGMAFSAGFLNYFLKGKSIQEALNFGNAAGALNAVKRGGTAFFNKNDVLHFMQNTSKVASSS